MVPAQLLARLLQWIVIAVFVGYFFGWMSAGRELVLAESLRNHGVQTPGKITAIAAGDAMNNPAAHYSYEAGNIVYFGYSHVSQAFSRKLAPGSTVDVLYLPDDPSQTGLDLDGMTSSACKGLLIAVGIELVLAAVFLAVIFRGRAPRPLASGRLSISNAPGNQLAATIVFTVMLVGGVSMLLFSALPGYRKAVALVDSGRRVQALITGVWDHTGKEGGGRYAEYSFQIDGQNYHGQTSYNGDYGDRGPIQVYYLPSDPYYSSGDPAQGVAKARQGVIFMTIWNVLLVGMGFAAFRSVKRRSLRRS